MSRWLISNSMEGTVQDSSTGQNEVKTIEQNQKDISDHPTEGKGVQLNHPGYEGDGNDVKDTNKTNVVPLKDGQHNTTNAIA